MAVAVDSFKLIMQQMSQDLRTVEQTLAIFGLLFVGKLAATTAYDLFVGIRAHFISRLFKRNYIEKYGKWAIVTGCTDGIGKGYAFELAKKGLNVLLLSRTLEKLKQTAEEIEEKYNVQTEVVQVDFSEGQNIYARISKSISNKEIGILVNNVGVMLPYPKFVENVTEQEIWSHINVNMASVPAMTNIVLPMMLTRNKGAIVNVASIAGTGPIPMMGIYAASKAFVDYWSQAAEWEYRYTGITFQTVTPSYVATNMVKFSSLLSNANFLTPNGYTFAKHALRTLGYARRTSGYWVHGIQVWGAQNIMTRTMFITIMYLLQLFFARSHKKTHNH